MANSKFNARHGLSVGSTPVDVIDSTGVLATASLPSLKTINSTSIVGTGDIVIASGTNGRGVSSITRTSGTGAAGTTDTYTITFTDSTTTTFTVVNGSNGTNGTNGTNGRGISTILRTTGSGAAGTTDTYTITFTDSTTTTFTVVNGSNGTNGTNGTNATMTYPGAGIAVSSGSAWSTSLTAPTGTIVGTSDAQTLTNKTLTTPVISSISNTGTLTLPTSTDTLIGRATTDTLTNKRVQPRVQTIAVAAATTAQAWNSDSYDQVNLTLSNTATVTLSLDGGTPTDGQKVMFRIKDDGTSRNYTFIASGAKCFRPIATTLPSATATVATKTTYIGCVYNSTGTGTWDVIAIGIEA